MKLTRKSYNRRVYTFGPLIFIAIALISTGFASWVMSTDKSDKIDGGSFEVGTITDGSLEFHDLGFEGDNVISFNPANGDIDGEIKWDGTNDENLSVTIKGSITPVSSFKELNIQMENTDVANKIPAGILAAVEKDYIVLPACAQAGGVTINTATTVPGSDAKYINVDSTDSTKLNFTYTISFAWGEAFNGMNPSVYLDTENNPSTSQPYTFAEKKAILMDFRTTVYPSLAGKTEQEIFTGSEDLKFRVNITAVAN